MMKENDERAFEKQPEHKCIKKHPSNVYHKSRYPGIDIFQYKWTNIHRYHLPYRRELFHKLSRQRCLKRYAKPILVVREKNQESLFKTFSKVPLHWKPPSSLQKYSQHLSSIFLQTNFLTRSFSYSSRFSSFFRHSTGREMAVRIFITDISRSKIERGRRFLMHRSLTIRNRKWDTKRCAVSSEEKGETIIHGRASRVSPLKNIIPSGNSSRVCKKTCTRVWNAI